MKKNLPPEPKSSIMGLGNELRKDILAFMTNLTLKHGHAVRFRFMLNFYAYQFTHPNHIKHILQEKNTIYTKNVPAFQALKKIEGNNLVVTEGDIWLQRRRLMQPVFLKNNVAIFCELMGQTTEKMLEKWEVYEKKEQEHEIYSAITKLTLEIISKALFSLNLADESEEIEPAVAYLSKYIFESVSNPFLYILMMLDAPTKRNKKLWKNMEVINGVVDKIISTRKKSQNQPNDLLEMLIKASEADNKTKLNDKDLRSEVLALMNAGHETTANSIIWALYLISQHQEVQNKIYQEVQEVLANKNPTFEDLANLPYTLATIKESMRIYPATYTTSRISTQEDEIAGYFIPKNAIINLPSYVTHRHSDFWEEPLSFKPERFLDPEKLVKFAYFPFGTGPHQCIGQLFALTEMQIVIAMIINKFEITLDETVKVEPVPLISLKPKNGLSLKFKRRA